jgi:hypothetical protein
LRRQYKEKAAAQEAAVQEILKIRKRNRLVVPSVPCSAAAVIKNGKTSSKRWNDFNRQAARREKAVELSVGEYTRLIAQPCLYSGAEENSGVDHVRSNESFAFKTGRGTPRSLYTLLHLCMSLFCLLRVSLFALGRVLT